jgi:hypothetical protein
MNSIKILMLSAAITLSVLFQSKAVELTDSVSTPQKEYEAKERFLIRANHKSIVIRDRETKDKLSIETPEWLKKQGVSAQPRVVVDPSHRFFLVHDQGHYSSYSLIDPLLKPGVYIDTKRLSQPVYSDDRVTIVIHKPASHAPFGTIQFQYRKGSGESAKIYTLNYPLPKPRWISFPQRAALMDYTRVAKAGLEATAHLASKTALHPHAAFYTRTIATWKDLSQTTCLNQKTIERAWWWIQHYKSKGFLRKDPDVFIEHIARTVFETGYSHVGRIDGPQPRHSLTVDSATSHVTSDDE